MTRSVGSAGSEALGATGWACFSSLLRELSPEGLPVRRLLRTSHSRRKRAAPRGAGTAGPGGGRCLSLHVQPPACPDPPTSSMFPWATLPGQMELQSCPWTASLQTPICAHHQTLAPTSSVLFKGRQVAGTEFPPLVPALPFGKFLLESSQRSLLGIQDAGRHARDHPWCLRRAPSGPAGFLP